VAAFIFSVWHSKISGLSAIWNDPNGLPDEGAKRMPGLSDFRVSRTVARIELLR
jgi:hypothetical protein